MKTIIAAMAALVSLLVPQVRLAPRVDGRALAQDPVTQSIYVGTVNGRVYFSDDAGDSWGLFTDLGSWNVISRISFTKDAMLVGAWNPFDSQHGTVWRYRNGKWDRPYVGSAVRAIGIDRNLIVIGTLAGVFASRDDGDTWQQIGDLKNVDSVAIDGRTIYAGTWHLAYKYRDFGRTWVIIDHGVVNDSDVMSILADDGVVYLSACSGIFKSENSGTRFVKMRGIPSSSRRTHMLAWKNASTVYAGTTEGLWETVDGGASWGRVTPKDWVINDILITRKGIFLAVDRSGVLELK